MPHRPVGGGREAIWKFKLILGCISSLKPAWATRDTLWKGERRWKREGGKDLRKQTECALAFVNLRAGPSLMNTLSLSTIV